MSKNDFFARSPSLGAFYARGTSGTEANMRQELIDMFDGKFPEIAKAQTGLLRRMRKDSNNRFIPCECVDIVTKEPDKDYFCPICFSEGFLWDEEELQLYRILEDSDVDNILRDRLDRPGLINIPLVVFYIRYDSDITRDDKIVELVLGLDGTTTTPRTRRAIYRIETVWDYRSDNGKLEYWKVFTHSESVRYLNSP